ncbi:putative transcription factor C2H2 family [Helianthus annuus]|nr:putative transcription factor C2H2 family [Helianthus annuus]
MSWRRIAKSLQAFCAHTSLFSFTLLLVLKLDRHIFSSWWIVFSPLFVFHLVVARGRFSLPAPSTPQNRHWAPCHSVVGMALLVAFELLLCVFLESVYVMKVPAVSLKIVFLPLLAFEIIILVDNVRMCKALLPVNEEHLTDEAIWETLPHFWISISMIFFIAATLFTLLKLCGDIGALGWWDLFVNFGIAECFAFLVCTNWSNPANHRNHQSHYASTSSSSSSNIRYLDWNSGLLVSSNNIHMNRESRLQYVGGHITKVPRYCVSNTSLYALRENTCGCRFLSLYRLSSLRYLYCKEQELYFLHLNWWMNTSSYRILGPHTGRLLDFSSETHDCFGFLYGGSRLIGWWYTDEESREEQARLYHAGATGYNTFCGYPPEVVKKMPKKALTEETSGCTFVSTLKSLLSANKNMKHFKIELSVVLLPCRHWVLCSKCSEKCKKCPICRVNIDERLLVHDT